MRVVFPSSISAWRSEEVSGPFVGFERAGTREYEEYLIASGSSVIHFGDPVEGARSLVFSREKLSDDVGGIVIPCEDPCKGRDLYGNDWGTYHDSVATDSRVSVIAIAAGSTPLLRIQFIKALCYAGRIARDKTYWLYGVENPAELALYPKILGNYSSRRFELAVCSTCFIYSLFGVEFSVSRGYYRQIPNTPVIRKMDLGMSRWARTDICAETRKRFELNSDTVRLFASGEGGAGYAERLEREVSV